MPLAQNGKTISYSQQFTLLNGKKQREKKPIQWQHDKEEPGAAGCPMKAMIFAAGLGTRLRPLTDSMPKALIEIDGAPLIQHVLGRLIEAGVTEVMINLHHYPEQIRAFLAHRNNFGIHIEYSEEKRLLDTGGGLRRVRHFFSDDKPFLVHNVDILSTIDFAAMAAQFKKSNCLALLAVNQRTTSRYLLFDAENTLCGWKSVAEDRRITAREPMGLEQERAFCGIHLVSPDIFGKITEKGAFSIIQTYLRLAQEGERICAFPAGRFAWRDVGKLDQIPPGRE